MSRYWREILTASVILIVFFLLVSLQMDSAERRYQPHPQQSTLPHDRP
jgi:hypothetical protein